MPNPLFKPPRHLVKEWPEVFDDLYMNTMPVAYLDFIHLVFEDGRVWEIDIKTELTKKDPESIADTLLNTLTEYKDEIVKIDFKVNINRLKSDIKDSTDTIF
jgi:hypothetical protein|tara:strand:+ start:7839 stop:8144 length:306 start_codon:yes stop_codon:yes gene_type:complete